MARRAKVDKMKKKIPKEMTKYLTVVLMTQESGLTR